MQIQKKKKYIVKTKRSLIRVIRVPITNYQNIDKQYKHYIGLFDPFIYGTSKHTFRDNCVAHSKQIAISKTPVTLELRPHSDPAAFLNNVKRQGKSPLTPSCVSTACSRRVHSVFKALSNSWNRGRIARKILKEKNYSFI